MISTRNSCPSIEVTPSFLNGLEEENPGSLLLQPDIFWDYCWPARLASILDARRATSELNGLVEADPACVVTAGGLFQEEELAGGLFQVGVSSSQWQSHGILARDMAGACAKVLEESASLRAVNTLHVLSAQMILKLLPLLNFLNAFDLWTEKFEGSRALVAASPTMLQVLRPLAAKRMPGLRVKLLPMSENTHRFRAKFYRPAHGWRRWKQAGGESVGMHSGDVDVLFTTVGGSPLKIIRKLAEQMMKDAPGRLATVAIEKANSVDLPTRHYNVDPGHPLPQHRIEHAIVEQITEQDATMTETFTYEGGSLWPLVKPHLLALAKTMVPAVAQAIDGLNDLFGTVKPRLLVVSNNSVWSDRAAVLVARRLGILSLAIQDGDYQTIWPWEILSDKIAVQGEQSARVLEEFGTPRAKIETTGQVRYDHLTGERIVSLERALRARLGVETEYLAVVATDPGSLTHSPFEKQNNEYYALQELANLANWSIIMKLHPQDRGAITRSLVRNRPKIRVISNEFRAEELIAACDLWVSTASTTAVEAVIASRPVALLNCNGGNFMPELVEAGVATYVRNDGELEAVARNIASPRETNNSPAKKREAFLHDRLYRLDGKSTERVVSLIQEMMHWQTDSRRASMLGAAVGEPSGTNCITGTNIGN
ncbi:MAG: CDP-glycerol glycerophosphotransferase family protein [Chloroflexi bacterium]|nr:CDP-glycerol glycerophosphotransferase family protein [Chloroflexota bacterium]